MRQITSTSANPCTVYGLHPRMSMLVTHVCNMRSHALPLSYWCAYCSSKRCIPQRTRHKGGHQSSSIWVQWSSLSPRSTPCFTSLLTPMWLSVTSVPSHFILVTHSSHCHSLQAEYMAGTKGTPPGLFGHFGMQKNYQNLHAQDFASKVFAHEFQQMSTG